MSKEKIKELNLLPKEYIFNISLYFVIRKIIILIPLNCFLLLCIVFYLHYQINTYTKNIKILKNKLEFAKSVNNKLVPYLNQVKKIKKKIEILDKKKKLYYINYNFIHSPLISFLVLNQNIFKGIKIKNINYSNGGFEITGFANSGKDYYKFYKKLENNKMISKVKFYYISLDKTTNFLSFKLDIYLKSIK